MYFKLICQQKTSRTHVCVSRSNDWIVQQCPTLLPVANDKINHKHVALVENIIVAEKNTFGDRGCMFTFCGAAAVGDIFDAFKAVDVAIPLQALPFFSMELTICDSYNLITPMSVRSLGHTLINDVSFVEHCIYLGWSLGALVVSETVLLCETALGQPCAMVMLDPRGTFPIKPRAQGAQESNLSELRAIFAVRVPKAAVLTKNGYAARHRIVVFNFVCVSPIL